MPVLRLLAFLALPLALSAVDLEHAAVVAPPGLNGPERKAVMMLLDEIEKRAQVRLELNTALPPANVPAIAILPARSVLKFPGAPTPGQAAEGFRIKVEGNRVWVVGNDARGVLFGVGHLLTSLRITRGKLTLDDRLDLATAPAIPLRGHQLGYRPKTNSYDGWTLAMWEQYIRDLAVFGTNAVELIPPRSDDDADSPLFPLPPMQTMIGMSRLLDEYGLDVWIWFPAMDKDYSDPRTVEFALKEWGEVFRQLPRVDAVFVPGGDPGHTQPKHLLALLEKQTEVLHRYHPKAQMWVSPQSFNQEWMDEFFALVRQEPKWLAGVVHGPQVRMGIDELRRRIPARYPIRNYPDITHTLRCQFPVSDWDAAFALTEGREPINPRPNDYANIFRYARPHSAGFITYSEGCNDDVNKVVWSALGWNPEARVIDILRRYSRYFLGPEYEDTFAQSILALERNWRGPLAANEGVYVTLQQLRALDDTATPQTKLNWRFQQALYRAYYDAYNRARLIDATHREQQALHVLRGARLVGSENALTEAEHILDRSVSVPPAAGWRARIFELAEALFQSIRMQLSVERYKAIAVGRGANLDTIDAPLNNGPWLKHRFEAIRKLTSERDKLEAIDAILNWTNPGPGGFYDDPGNPLQQPHVVRGAGPQEDPQFLRSSLTAFAGALRDANGPYRTAWLTHAESLIDEPLRLRYDNLDPAAGYKVRVIYAGETTAAEIRLTANGREVHAFRKRPVPVTPLEFDVPAGAVTAGGELTLEWTRTPGLGGNGRGNHVSEIWLIRK